MTNGNDSFTPLPDTADEATRAGLAAAYPEFRFSRLARGRRGPAWVAVRKKGTDQGLHTAVTASMDELQAALLLDAVETRRGLPVSRDAALWDSLL